MTRNNELDQLAAFTTEAQRRIRAVDTIEGYSLVSWWVFGAPEYKRLPAGSVSDLLAQMEAKRIDVIGKSGALAG